MSLDESPQPDLQHANNLHMAAQPDSAVASLSFNYSNRLAVETLCEIFMIVKDCELLDFHSGNLRFLSSPETISAVSPRWREIAHSLPLLWSYMQLGYYNPDVSKRPFIRASLTRWHIRHLDLSRGQPLDLILGTMQEFYRIDWFCAVGYTAEVIPWERIKSLFILSVDTNNLYMHNVRCETFLSSINRKNSRIRTLRTYLCMEKGFMAGPRPPSEQIRVAYTMQFNHLPGRPKIGIKRMKISCTQKTRNILKHQLQLMGQFSLEDLTLEYAHLKDGKTLTEAFKWMGSSLTRLTLGPLYWRSLPWGDALILLPKLEFLKLHQDSQQMERQVPNYNSIKEKAFIEILDALPKIEPKLRKLSEIEIITTHQYDGRSLIQFIQSVEENKVRRGMGCRLLISSGTFKPADMEVLAAMTELSLA